MRGLLHIEAPASPLEGEVALPPSKSIANRALICAALAGDPDLAEGIGDADDTLLLRTGLSALGKEVHCGLGGTTLRFLLAWASVQEGREIHLSAGPTLLQRPHDELVETLRVLGADVHRMEDGFLVRGGRIPGGEVTIHSPVSSQFISALMLVAHRMEQGLRIHWTGRRLSEPYVRMTARVMEAFGLPVAMDRTSIHLPHGRPVRRVFRVPLDWSSAGFWAEAVAMVPASSVLLSSLHRDEWQGDEAAMDLWHPFVQSSADADGVRMTHRVSTLDGPREIDLSATPDLFPALALTYAARGVAVKFTGLHNLALKESDRMAAVADLLCRGGVRVVTDPSTLSMEGRWNGPLDMVVDPMGDHRMAMAAAPLAAICGGLFVKDEEVVRKSYPGYWQALARGGFLIRHV